MNVLIIINSFRLGGAEKLCYDLARKLSQKPDVKVFLYSVGKVQNLLENELFQSFSGTPVIVGAFDKPYKKQRLKTAWKIRRFCRLNNIDIVHTNGQSPDFLARCSKLFGNKSKIVVTIHSTVGYSKKQEAFFSVCTNAYTAVSKEALQYSKQDLGISKNIELINNGIDISTYSEIQKTNDVFEILSVGRVQPQKDYIGAAQYLEKFLKQHKEVKWLIFGDCEYDESYLNEFKNECVKLGILNSVVLKGVVTDPLEIYCHGDVFVLASPFEGFGIAFIEAIMSDHYIFARHVGAIQDIKKCGGIIHSIDDERSPAVLEAIYSNSYYSNEVTQNKKIVSNLYALDNMVEKYYAVYEEVLRNE